MEEKKSKLKNFRIFVLSFGSFIAFLFLISFLPKLISSMMGETTQLAPESQWEGQIMTAMFILYMFGYGIGWWRAIWGGIIIILSALLVSLPFIIVQSNYGALIFGIPQLIIGVLYIILSIMEHKAVHPK